MKRVALAFVLMFVMSFAAIAQTPADVNVRYMVNGKVVDQTGQPVTYSATAAESFASTSSSTGKILVWTDRKYYQWGEEIRLRAMGLADDATQLQVWVSESLYSDQGSLITSSTQLCECGDSNGGYIPSLAPFNFITLYHKRVPQGFAGHYDFNIQFNKLPGNGAPPVPYQSTRVSVIDLFTTAVDTNPIVIDSLVNGYNPTDGARILLTGHFPKNVALFFFTGSIPYSGVFNISPSVTSTDGTTLIVQSIMGLKFEGRVALMLPDGSFATVSPQTFVPLPMPSNVGR